MKVRKVWASNTVFEALANRNSDDSLQVREVWALDAFLSAQERFLSFSDAQNLTIRRSGKLGPFLHSQA